MPTLSGKELEDKLAAAGNNLLQPPSSVDELLSLLDQIEDLLTKVEQSPAKSMQTALSPLMNALLVEKLLKHSDADVKVGIASCISEITRITAPEAPYDDDTMKDVFRLIVSSFEHLSDTSNRSHAKRTAILEIVAKVRSCVIMLDLECDQLIIEMFQHFLKSIRDYHTEVIFGSMETIMSLVLEESEDISPDLLSPILSTLKKNNEAVLPIAKKLAERVIQNTADKIRPYMAQAVKSLDASVDDFSEVVSSLFGKNSDVDGHSNDCNSKDHANAKDVVGETNSKDEDPDAVKSPELILRDRIDEMNIEEKTDANLLKADDSNHHLDAKATTDTEVADCVAEKSVESEEKRDNAEAKQEACKDESPGEDAHISDAEAKPVEEPKSVDEVKETQPQPEAPRHEAEDAASPIQSDNIPDENESKEDRLEKKENPVSGEKASKDNASEKASEEEHISVSKKRRRPGKKQAAKTVDKGKTLTDKGTSNNNDGCTSESVAKSLEETEKLGDASNKMEDGSSLSKEVRKKGGRAKSAPEKDVPKSSAKEDHRKETPTSLKATKDQDIQEETPRASAKRKRTPGTEKASGTMEYGQNLVGSSVKVYWPEDKMYYEGVVASYNSAKKQHKVLYVDGDEEILNLKKERWEILEKGSTSDGEQDGGNSKREATSDIKSKKKGKGKTEPLSKRQKVDTSPKTAKSKLKAAATKSGGKSAKNDGQAESESKPNNSKPGKKSGDDAVKSKEISQKPKGKSQGDAPKTSGGSKGDDDEKTPGQSKQASQKSSKTKGRPPKGGKTPGGGKTAKSSSSKAKETEPKEESPEPEKSPEQVKGKSTDNAKTRDGETKSGKRRRKSNI
ncbi:sister chromatid cohesion protein PDS5 homolog C-like [Andrographis paniculata]|uniref:sister chromatid cohesion protein PDS5 homolog C-like n=1 Tax=Andrographis paniculata TaxID=175694 RepID=UPI0021E90B9C|nr:sister chromatid cohesion protein PDS5 homolog C-like [Andrographis paniculata]